MFSKENGKKAEHGIRAGKTLDKTLDQLDNLGAVADVKDGPQYGYPGLDPEQFAAHKEVRLSDGTSMVLFHTSSIRSDRIETDQWRASNIKKIDERIEYAFVVIPDEEASAKNLAPREKIRSGKSYSAIDDILTVKEFYDKALTWHSSTMGIGASNDLAGRGLEKVVSAVMSDRGNLERAQGDAVATGYMYDLFLKIMLAVSADPKSIIKIDSRIDIPRLPNHGNPKTDVACKFYFADGSERLATFSVKNTSQRNVSVHQYNADAFSDVLDPHNKELRRLLRAFQAAGCARDMAAEDRDNLAVALRPYLRKLDMWVFGGYGAQEARPIQIANYLIVHDKNTGLFAVHSVEEYCDKLEQNNKGNTGFGTIFSWTYASKKRGECIQLKAPIFF